FVETVTDPGSSDYVTPADRIAVFDNDGTLWAEQPVYFQFIFAMDRIAEMAAEDPSVVSGKALEAAASGDLEGVLAEGEAGLVAVIDATHSGIGVDDFQADVRAWLDATPHPTRNRPFDTLIYQPMLELLRYLRDEGFTTYIVSGGGVHFIRTFAEDAYNIPPEQVIGSRSNAAYETVDGRAGIVKKPGIAFLDDKAGKPVAIDEKIGKRPILAGGNSDGDFEMLEWTTAGDGRRLGLIVHHTDAAREWAYDRDSHIGRLERGLDEGPARGWLIVDMADDWKTVFPAQ
ncbi:MAG: HAD family hydrolase, partial [Pseudomonadota bacterium]